MSKFLKIAAEHQANMQRILEEETNPVVSYGQAATMGLLKPMTIRLPVDAVAKLEVIQTSGFWSSKQEIIYDMVVSAIADFYAEAGEHYKTAMDEAAKASLDAYKLEDRAKSFYELAPNFAKEGKTEADFVADCVNQGSLPDYNGSIV